MPQARKRFLILDDEESIRHSIAAYMEDEGYQVFEADSTEQALEIVRSHSIDHAVVDIRLPGDDGNAFMLKAREINPDIRFIIHTGSADYVLPEAIRKLGVTDEMIVIKPARDLSVLSEKFHQQD